MKITIMGPPGSGKSTLAKGLAKHFGFKHFSGGDFRRKVAEEHGMTISELNKIGETEFWTDKEVDEVLMKMEKEEDDFVVDSHMAWHFIPSSIKIYVDTDEKERAKRTFDRKGKAERFESVEDTMKKNKERMESDKKRYKKYYNVDHYDKIHYDIILDCTGKTPDETLAAALETIAKYKKEAKV